MRNIMIKRDGVMENYNFPGISTSKKTTENKLKIELKLPNFEIYLE